MLNIYVLMYVRLEEQGVTLSTEPWHCGQAICRSRWFRTRQAPKWSYLTEHPSDQISNEIDNNMDSFQIESFLYLAVMHIRGPILPPAMFRREDPLRIVQFRQARYRWREPTMMITSYSRRTFPWLEDRSNWQFGIQSYIRQVFAGRGSSESFPATD